MTAFAVADDVAARWRTLTSEESAVADTLAADASDMIRARWPDVDARIVAGSIAPSSVTRVVAGMVKRAMNVGDAEGLESFTQGAGPFAFGGKVSNPNGNLYLTAEDCRLFDGYTPAMRLGWAL